MVSDNKKQWECEGESDLAVVPAAPVKRMNEVIGNASLMEN